MVGEMCRWKEVDSRKSVDLSTNPLSVTTAWCLGETPLAKRPIALLVKGSISRRTWSRRSLSHQRKR